MSTKAKIIIGIILVSVAIGIGIIAYLYTRQQASPATQQSKPTSFDSPAMSQETLDEMKEFDRVNSPSTYLANMLPVDMTTFSMTYSIDKERKTLVFQVEPKELSLQLVQEDMQSWLISIGLTSEQIDTLIIEYDTSVN